MDLDIQSLLQQEKTAIRDGIDMSVCVIDKKQNTLQFAGAKNPMIYIQDGELNLIKGDKFSIGGKSPKHVKRFTSTTIDISKPTCIYLFSDGYQDQFGGPDGRKYMIKRLKEQLLNIHTQPMSYQKRILEENLNEWMNGERQIDDILVMGFHFSQEKKS